LFCDIIANRTKITQALRSMSWVPFGALNITSRIIYGIDTGLDTNFCLLGNNWCMELWHLSPT